MDLRKSLAYVAFLATTLVWLPFSILAFLLLSIRAGIVSRRLSVSATATGVLNGRMLMHLFGLKDDPVAVLLADALPNNTPLALKAMFLPHYVYYILSGGHRLFPAVAAPGEEVIRNIVVNRTLYIDALLADAAPNVEQFVLLGAGFDTRNYASTGPLRSLLRFELDLAPTQQLKREALRRAGVSTQDVHYLPVDFADRNWPTCLVDSEYDPTKPTVFLWEGVTLYITEDDIRATLSAVKQHAPTGSVLILDLYSPKMIRGKATNNFFRRLLSITNEEFQYRIDFGDDARATITNFAESNGWTVGKSYIFGEKTDMGPWMSVVELRL